MEQRVAIVTGGLRGLGRAMAFGLAREGHHVVAVGHIDADIATVEAETASRQARGADPAARRRSAPARRLRPRRGNGAVAVWRRAHPRQQCGPDLHDDRPGPLPAGRAAEVLAGAGRHRARRHRDQLHRRRPDGPPRGALHGRAGLGPHRQRDDKARHDEPAAHLALRRLEGGARNGDRGVGEGGRGNRPDDQHRQSRRRRQHARAWPRRCAR